MHKLRVNPKYTKTYASEENLNKALAELNLSDDLNFLVVPVGDRVTAVFTNSMHSKEPDMMTHLVHSGFMVVG